MPSICQFYGILIFMHLTRKEHNPPHIHAYYGDYEATFYINTGKLMFGKFPKNGCELVKKFIDTYREDLQEMWDKEMYKKLPPIE